MRVISTITRTVFKTMFKTMFKTIFLIVLFYCITTSNFLSGIQQVECKQKKKYKKCIKMVSTSYTHTGNCTATGIYPYKGIVAVDPSVIPLHTKLYIEGYGNAVAEDTGRDIIGYRIDVFHETYQEAIQWGRKEVKVYIYE